MSFINRELSWLEFNQRVLDEAQRQDLASLERLKFLSITASNMDEFFQVRVGGLQLLQQSGSRILDISGLTPSQQLVAIRKRAKVMSDDQYDLLNDQLLPALAKENIEIIDLTEHQISPAQTQYLSVKFKDFISPLLTPLAYFPDTPAPSLPAMRIIVACELQNTENKETRIVFIPVPEGIPRFTRIDQSDVVVSTAKSTSVESTPVGKLTPVEQVIAAFAEDLFPDETLLTSMPLRLTRNSDIALQEEDIINLPGQMEKVLAARKNGETVRLEYLHSAPQKLTNRLKSILETPEDQTSKVRGPLALHDFISLALSSGYDHLRDSSWEPQPSPDLDPNISIFDTLAERDLLLNHPYESFEPVLRFIEEAAVDPATVAIKQVLYRTASHSRVIDALIKAAHNGKQVTVLVELKARFDEAQNLLRADELQRAGVQIVYGVKGLKTHAKICLIIRNEDGQLKRYVHLGTGNYNESTARIYTDISYFTSNTSYGSDASLFFNAVTGRSKLTRFQKLIPAPTHMKQRLLELITAEAKRAKNGEKASITAKVNSLQDQEIIQALYKAAKHGVIINLNIRGVCCLQTGTEKGLKNIRVISVIDRYLEHARIFSFHHGGSPLMYIASADWMTRNLDKRIELMIPIEDPACKKRLQGILEAAFKDTSNGFEILPDGTSRRVSAKKGQKKFRMQEHLQQQAKKTARTRAHERSTTFDSPTPIN
ncbi:polyphosphate kinase 1 [Akkermansiaceae bacterium]|nr:polyphosphate kinase 1 [Akkermansiaceae bacterium]